MAECSRLGAAMVHLHVRDACGRLTPDLALLQQTVRLIREQCDVIVEISTGGVSELNSIIDKIRQVESVIDIERTTG